MKRIESIEKILNSLENRETFYIGKQNAFSYEEKFVLDASQKHLESLKEELAFYENASSCIKELRLLHANIVQEVKVLRGEYFYKKDNVLFVGFSPDTCEGRRAASTLMVETAEELTKEKLSQLQQEKWKGIPLLEKIAIIIAIYKKEIQLQERWIAFLEEEV